MSVKRLIVGLLCLLGSGVGGSVWGAAGTDSASFLKIPVGAGPAAMGSAYSALATDAYAPVYNPAGLGFLPSTQISAQHLSYIESVHYEFLSMVHPLSKQQSIGASVQYLGSGDMTTTNTDGDPIGGDFSARYAAYTLAYGRSLGEKLSLGVAGKFIDAKISDVGANAYAFDAGGLYKVTDTVNLAAVVSNVGSKLKFLSESGPLPMAFRLGGSARLFRTFTASADGVYLKEEDQLSGHFGLAWRPVSMISLRTGYRTDTLKGLSAIAGFSAGLGVDLWGQEFSYAWVPYGELGNTQYFSLILRFGAAEEAKRNLIEYRKIKSHRTVKSSSENTDPDYQQLMQLLSDQDREFMSARPTYRGSNE